MAAAGFAHVATICSSRQGGRGYGREKVWQSGIAEGIPWPMHCMIGVQDTLFGFFTVCADPNDQLKWVGSCC